MSFSIRNRPHPEQNQEKQTPEQCWQGESLLPFLRAYFPVPRKPNFNYQPMVDVCTALNRLMRERGMQEVMRSSLTDLLGHTNSEGGVRHAMSNAQYFANMLMDFDRNPSLADQLVYYITTGYGHDGMAPITRHREVVALLLIRHYQTYGGLVLPPLPAARQVNTDYAAQVVAAKARGQTMEYPIHYPSWAYRQMIAPTPVSCDVGLTLYT